MPEINSIAEILITVGGLFFAGLVADLIGHRTALPRVTILLAAGFVVGPAGLNWLPTFMTDLFPVLTAIALTMVGFLLGQRLTRSMLQGIGKLVLGMSISVVFLTAIVVSLGLILLGVPVELALLLPALALLRRRQH